MAAGNRFRRFRKKEEIPKTNNLKDLAEALKKGEIPYDIKEEIPYDLECMDGACGPYIKTEKLEWHNLDVEVQKWLVRLDPDDLALIKDAVSAFALRRTITKWIRRTFWGAITGFGAVYAAGEKLSSFLHFIESTGFNPTAILQGLKHSAGF